MLLTAANDTVRPQIPNGLEWLTQGFVVITTLAVTLMGF